MGELVDGGGDFKTLEKNALLSLDTDVLRPFDETGEVSHGLDVAADSEVLWGLLEERTLLVRSGGGFTNNGGLSLSSFLYLILNHR